MRIRGFLIPIAACVVLSFAWGIGVGARQWFPYRSVQAVFQAVRASPEALPEVAEPRLEDIRAGAYLIHLRHAHRHETIDVTAADFFETAEGTGEWLAPATCLSDEGRQQAELTKRSFEALGIDVDRIISSGSCRANEHATIAFGNAVVVDPRHLHLTAIPESQKSIHVDGQLAALKELFEAPEGTVTVIVGHELEPYGCRILRCAGSKQPREMGGVSLLMLKESEIVEVWRYPRLSDFFLSLS